MTAVVGPHHVHVACPAGSEDTLRQFYGQVLDIAEVPEPPVLAARGGGCGSVRARVRATAVSRIRSRRHAWNIRGSQHRMWIPWLWPWMGRGACGLG